MYENKRRKLWEQGMVWANGGGIEIIRNKYETIVEIIRL